MPGEPAGHGGADAALTFSRNSAAMRLDEVLDDRQSQPGTSLFARPGLDRLDKTARTPVPDAREAMPEPLSVTLTAIPAPSTRLRQVMRPPRGV